MYDCEKFYYGLLEVYEFKTQYSNKTPLSANCDLVYFALYNQLRCSYDCYLSYAYYVYPSYVRDEIKWQ